MRAPAGSAGARAPAEPLAAQLQRQGLPGPGAVVLLLLLVGVLSRWATRGQLVQAWDAGNFVLALGDFDLSRHQPHLPGVFWILIAMGRLCRPLVAGDPVAALTLVNALASALALPCGWYLAFRIGGLRAAWWMAALLFSAPLLWFYASQPLSYGAELGWVVALACCAWGVAAGERRWLLPLALLMATAGGVRPNTPLFLLPLVLVCCWRGWRRGLAAWRLVLAVLLGLGVLAWWGQAFLQEAGGLEAFWSLFRSWKQAHTAQASRGGLLGNAWLLTKTIALTAPAGLALALWRWRRSGQGSAGVAWARGPRPMGWPQLFLLLWLLPALLYFLLVHFTRMGHATTLLPAVLLALALRLAAVTPDRGRWRWPCELLVVVGLQMLLFLLVPGDRFAQELRSYDHDWGVAIQAARRFDPATTLVVTTGRSNARAYRLPSVHLPAYDHGDADRQLEEDRDGMPVRPPLERLVVLDRGLAFPLPALPGVRQEILIPGRLQLIEVPVPPEGLRLSRRTLAPLR